MGNAKENFKQALFAVIETYGTEILNDSRRINALLMDYAPGQTRERKLIVSALEEGIGGDLLKARDRDSSELKLCVNRCIRCLVDATWVTEEAAQFAVDSISYALGIRITELPQKRINASAPKQDHSLELIKGTILSNNADLPALLNQYQVIGYKAFAANPTLENLILPQAIREIKPQAFLDCIHLKQVSLPAAIEAIGAGAFSGCDSLETIQIQPNSNYTVVGGMLIDKKNKTLMRVTKSASSKCNIPCEITTIQPRAFERIDICSIILPRNLSVLSGNAFVFCEKLESFEIDRHNALYSTIEGV